MFDPASGGNVTGETDEELVDLYDTSWKLLPRDDESFQRCEN